MTEQEKLAKVRAGTARMVRGMRGLLHGWEGLQEGARIIAEAEPQAVVQAMDLAAGLAPIMAQLKVATGLAEVALEEMDRKRGRDTDPDVDSGSGQA